MRAIPQVPLDGEQYSGPWKGVPAVLEYDGPTGGYKLVVAMEAGVAINISGTVEVTGGEITLVGGAQYGEDTPHTTNVTGTYVMGVRQDVEGTPVSADGDYQSFLFDYLGRLRTYSEGQAYGLTGSTTLGDALANQTLAGVGTYGLGYDPVAATWRRLRVDPSTAGLLVSVTGSIDTELPAAAALSDTFANPTAPAVGAFGMSYEPTVAGAWVRNKAYYIQGDGFGDIPYSDVSPTLHVAASTLGFVAEGSGALENILSIGSHLAVTMVSGSFPQGSVDPEGRLYTSALVTGTITLETGDISIGAVEIKNADSDLRAVVNVLADSMTQPTGTLAVGGYGMIYDDEDDEWHRLRGIEADLSTRIIDEGQDTTAFVSILYGEYESGEGEFSFRPIGAVNPKESLNPAIFGNALPTTSMTMGFNGTTWDRILGNRRVGLYVSMISGTFPGQIGATLLDDAVANPYAGLVGALGLAWDPVAATWSRIRIDTRDNLLVSLASGSFPGQADTFEMTDDAITTFTKAGIVGAFQYQYDGVADNWERARVYDDADLTDPRAQRMLTFGHGYDPGGGNWDRLIGPRETGLNVSLISGSWPTDALTVAGQTFDAEGRLNTRAFVTGSIDLNVGDIQIGAVEIKNADSDLRAVVNILADAQVAPTGTLATAAYLEGYDPIADDWNRVRVEATQHSLYVSLGSGSFPGQVSSLDLNNPIPSETKAGAVAALGYVYVSSAGTWGRKTEYNDDDAINPLAERRLTFPSAYNGSTWDRQTIDPEGRLHVRAFVTGTVDTELPAALVLADAMANPTVPGVGSHLMGYNGETWDRLYMGQSGSLSVDLITALDAATDEITAYVTGSVSVTGQTFDSEDRLNVSAFVTGTISQRTISNNPLDGVGPSLFYPLEMNGTAIVFSPSTLFGYDPIADDFNRVRVEASQHSMFVSLGSGTFPGQGTTFGMDGTIPPNIGAGAVASLGFEFVVPNLLWERVNSYDDADAINPRGQRKMVFGHGYDTVDDDWDRLIGPKESGLNVSLISGSFPDGIDVLPGDGIAAGRKSLASTAFLMAYNGVTYDRLYMGQSGSLAVDLITGLDAINDEVTAYVTGSVVAIEPRETGLNVSMISGSFPDGADVLPGDAIDAGRKSLATTAFLMAYNGATYDRLYMGQSGSLAVDLISQLDAINDEVTAYVTGTVQVQRVDGKATYRTVFNDLSAPSGTAVALIGAAGVTVRVLQVQIAKPSANQTPLVLAKFSTAPTGGSSTSPTPVPFDSDDAAASATINLYTTIPTDGSLVGSVFDADIASGDVVYEVFGEHQNSQAIVLRGTGEYLAIQPSVVATLNGFIEWTEE